MSSLFGRQESGSRGKLPFSASWCAGGAATFAAAGELRAIVAVAVGGLLGSLRGSLAIAYPVFLVRLCLWSPLWGCLPWVVGDEFSLRWLVVWLKKAKME